MASELSQLIEDELKHKGYRLDDVDEEAPHQALMGALRVEARVKEQQAHRKLITFKRVVAIGGGLALVLMVCILLVAKSKEDGSPLSKLSPPVLHAYSPPMPEQTSSIPLEPGTASPSPELQSLSSPPMPSSPAPSLPPASKQPPTPSPPVTAPPSLLPPPPSPMPPAAKLPPSPRASSTPGPPSPLPSTQSETLAPYFPDQPSPPAPYFPDQPSPPAPYFPDQPSPPAPQPQPAPAESAETPPLPSSKANANLTSPDVPATPRAAPPSAALPLLDSQADKKPGLLLAQNPIPPPPPPTP